MTDQQEHVEYEVVVVGGGPAGQMAAMYSTRLGHRTALVDRGGGRGAMMQEVHNVIGIREETSGNELLATGKEQLRGRVRRARHRLQRRASRSTAPPNGTWFTLLPAL